jgi:NADH-quinone oxidoreductase subunit D
MSAARAATLALGPAQRLAHGAARLELELDGERIVELDVAVGFSHRGFEKECEAGSWQRAVLYAERLNYQSALLSSTAYCLAVEKLAGCAVPRRAQWLRVLGGELSRVADHLTRLSVTCRELGALTPFAAGMEAREQAWDLQEALCGGRVTPGWLQVGGVVRDEPEGYGERLEAALAQLERRLADFDRLARSGRAFASRLRGVGALRRERLIELGVTGPLLRAAGVAYDLRKADPYLAYAELDFDVPVGSAGDGLDRFLVCREEIAQSLRIARQCLPPLRETRGEPIAVPVPGVEDESDERPWDRGVAGLPVGEAYSAIESANGELGFYVVSDGRARPCRVRCRPPSFLHAAALREMLRGAMLSDVAPTLALVNSVGGECDR